MSKVQDIAIVLCLSVGSVMHTIRAYNHAGSQRQSNQLLNLALSRSKTSFLPSATPDNALPLQGEQAELPVSIPAVVTEQPCWSIASTKNKVLILHPYVPSASSSPATLCSAACFSGHCWLELPLQGVHQSQLKAVAYMVGNIFVRGRCLCSLLWSVSL